MKTLIFINGPMGVGKSVVCKALLERLTPGVYLDGDWCWNMNPFQVTDETRAMVLDNITAMLSRFLACRRTGTQYDLSAALCQSKYS